jgi:arginase
MKPIAFVGAAFSIGGAATGSRQAPAFYRHYATPHYPNTIWHRIIWQQSNQLQAYPHSVAVIKNACQKLAHHVKGLRQGYFPIVIGGDHSCAVGTWSGISQHKAPIGLLWIDAHFDSHTPATSQSQRIHGMPLALLLGQGDTRLMLQPRAVIDSRYTVVFGVHSFEVGEPELMAQLHIRYYTTTEIKQRGLNTCLREAWRHVSACPQGFGLSIDLDGIDPTFTPAVSVPEAHGLSLPLLLNTLKHLPTTKLKALEVVEFNPYYDRNRRTLKALTAIINHVIRRKT